MSKHKGHRKHVFFATYTRCPTHSGTSETTNAKAEEHCCGARYSQVGIGCQIVSEKCWNHGPRHLMMAWFCKAKGGKNTVHTAATIGTRARESGKNKHHFQPWRCALGILYLSPDIHGWKKSWIVRTFLPNDPIPHRSDRYIHTILLTLTQVTQPKMPWRHVRMTVLFFKAEHKAPQYLREGWMGWMPQPWHLAKHELFTAKEKKCGWRLKLLDKVLSIGIQFH